MPNSQQPKKIKPIFLVLRITVVVFGIIWGIHRITSEDRWGDLVEAYSQMRMAAFAGCVGIFIVSMIIIGFRWWLLLRTQSVFIGFWAAVRLYFLGWFYNNFMPSSVGGDLVRAWYVTKHTSKTFEGVLSVFVDRIVGLVSTLLIAAFFYVIFLRHIDAQISFGPGSLGFVTKYKEVFLWATGIVLLGFCLLLLRKQGRMLVGKAWAYVGVHGLKAMAKFKNATILYCSRPLVLVVAFWLTVLLQIMAITGFWLLGRSMGVDTSIKYYYVFFTLVWIVGAVPISIGGLVVMEGVLVFLFVQYAGVQEGTAWAIALSQRLVWWVVSLPGAVIHLIGAHLPREFSVDYN